MAGFKNQHYVQKAYLEGFSAKHLPDKWQNTKAIWVLRKDTGRIRLQSIKKTAVRKYYYSFLDKKGAMNPLIEKWFNPVEKEFPKLRQHIRDHISEINLTGEASNLFRMIHGTLRLMPGCSFACSCFHPLGYNWN